MRRQQQPLDLARHIVARRGLLRKDVGRGAKPTALDLTQEFGEIDHPARLISRKTEPGAIISNSRLPRNPWLSLVTAANTTMTSLVFNTPSSDAETTPKPAMKWSDTHGS